MGLCEVGHLRTRVRERGFFCKFVYNVANTILKCPLNFARLCAGSRAGACDSLGITVNIDEMNLAISIKAISI